MAIIFVNRFYWPDEPATAQLLTDLAESLAAAGNEVAVIASRNRKLKAPREEVRRGVRICRVGGTRFGEKNLIGRAVDFLIFSLGALLRLARIVRQGDAVVIMTDPPLLGIPAAALTRSRRARLLHWVQDIYPEIAMAVTGSTWLRWLRPWRDWAWRQAEYCVAPGDDMAELIRRRGANAVVIPNWAPGGLAPTTADDLRTTWGLREKFIAAYSGNLGRVHELLPLLDAAEALRDETNIAFIFIGNGAQRPALEKAVKTRGLSRVYFFPPQPREQLGKTLALGDAHFVTLRAGCEQLVFPSKFHGIAAAARPVLFVGPRDCALARLVRKQNLGLAFTAEETTPLADALRLLRDDPARRRALGEAAARFDRESGGFNHAVAAWQKIFQSPSGKTEKNIVAG
ncbi:MAG TPA: glycosyltransferase family 4 protein [Opitutaceae bacterium]|nr:glycosyltransferase family 4 protein [Opitutaceae bacterium]